MEPHPSARADKIRVVCGVIGLVVFAMGCKFVGKGYDPHTSVILLMVAFTFASEAYSYTGSRDLRRRSRGKLAGLAALASFGPMAWLCLTIDSHASPMPYKSPFIVTAILSQILLFCAYFGQPYERCGKS